MDIKQIILTTEWSKWLKNTSIFFAPFALVFLVAIQSGSDIKDALNILYLFALNTTIDLIRKFMSANAELK